MGTFEETRSDDRRHLRRAEEDRPGGLNAVTSRSSALAFAEPVMPDPSFGVDEVERRPTMVRDAS
jgi:hypothetical protein